MQSNAVQCTAIKCNNIAVVQFLLGTGPQRTLHWTCAVSCTNVQGLCSIYSDLLSAISTNPLTGGLQFLNWIICNRELFEQILIFYSDIIKR